jgi:hypothetical protein
VVKHCGPDTLRLVPGHINQDAQPPPVLVSYIINYLQTHTAMRQLHGGPGAPQQAAAPQQQSQQAQPRAAPGALSRSAAACACRSALKGPLRSCLPG